MSERGRLRVVIAESSPRVGLRGAFAADPVIEIVGVAADGTRAVDLTQRLRADVVVIDARVSHVNALEATRRIMTESPTPIVLVTDEADPRGVQISMEALRAGALATTPTHSSALIKTVRAMAGLKLVRRWRDQPRTESPDLPSAGLRKSPRPSVIAIGASTGGPAALHMVLSSMSDACAVPILVTQHISPGFVRGMVRWLDESTPLAVKVAEHGEPLLAGTVFVAADDRHLTVARDRTIALVDGDVEEGHRPSATVLFRSVADVFGPKSIAVILTGMGRDGSGGLAAVRRAGGFVIAQDEETSAVFGMPMAAIADGVTDLVLPLDAISGYLMSATAL
jgi:two-component system chemotaxis response regulator CheB